MCSVYSSVSCDVDLLLVIGILLNITQPSTFTRSFTFQSLPSGRGSCTGSQVKPYSYDIFEIVIFIYLNMNMHLSIIHLFSHMQYVYTYAFYIYILVFSSSLGYARINTE